MTQAPPSRLLSKLTFPARGVAGGGILTSLMGGCVPRSNMRHRPTPRGDNAKVSVKESTAFVGKKKKPKKVLAAASKPKPRPMPMPKPSVTAGPAKSRAQAKKGTATAKAKATSKKKRWIKGARRSKRVSE